ncbi:hypothetical protein HDV00_005867 [Rhizophlyctis rosea]|nr:hypothetical protein HDV00_005867 [Rhizophlyctis rosea]
MEPNSIEVDTVDEEEWLSIEQALAKAEALLLPPTPAPSRPPLRRSLSAKYSKGYLSVTDFTSLQWCEQYVFYESTTIAYRRPETEAMRAGKDIHKALELEVSDQVPVEIVTKEDTWGLRLLNTIINLEALLTTGIAREVPIFGKIGPFLIFGIIDEIRREPNPDANGWTWVISDTKTRSKWTTPSLRSSQTSANRLQLSIYKLFFDSLAVGTFDSAFFLDTLTKLGIVVDAQFSESFRDTITATDADCLGLHPAISSQPLTDTSLFKDPLNLRSLLSIFQSYFSLFSPSSPTMEITYRSQQTGQIIKSHHFTFDAVWMQSHLQKAVEFWTGARRPDGVEDIEEAWKCVSCDFADECQWRLNKCRELERRGYR